MSDIYTKILDIQSKAVSLIKDTKGYNYKYADLAQLIATIQPHLTNQKLVVVYTVKPDNTLTMTLRDTETASEIISSVLMDGQTKLQGAQAVGSMITYYRRYLLIAALNIVVDDDDGAAATKRLPMSEPKYKYTAGQLNAMTAEVADTKAFKGYCVDCGIRKLDDGSYTSILPISLDVFGGDKI